MNYHPRILEKKLISYSQYFKVVYLTGARQVGKTTLLQKIFPKYKLLTFDPLEDLYGARRDPDLFLKNFPPPLILDEIQYAPELLAAIKRKVDQSSEKGQYILSGSQNLSVMRNLSESLAGRVGIIELSNMIFGELIGNEKPQIWISTYLDNPRTLQDCVKGRHQSFDRVLRSVWRGSYPGLCSFPDEMIASYFQSYFQTYVQRDVRLMENIRDLSLFTRFLALLAALTAQEINVSHLGRELSLSPATARKWLDLLVHSFLYLEIPAYSGNCIKRLSLKKKGYFRDSGLACYLQKVSSEEALGVNPRMGALFETAVVQNIYNQSLCLEMPPNFYHWRTYAGAEVDLILEKNGLLYPIEIKCKSHLQKKDLRGFRAFREAYPSGQIGLSLVIYAGDECYYLDDQTLALPWNVEV